MAIRTLKERIFPWIVCQTRLQSTSISRAILRPDIFFSIIIILIFLDKSAIINMMIEK